ncbi:ComEC/Rec2 family competence protein [Rubrobacter indicoceani]|uniref:ComEC/Rec2 family competence protein n=1 Tax=Rubrobacter indicoceani TaxID=2051957 RepID=UPI000E5B6EB1|nr:ComEC/Rec2 family competence protein [Rubrobacter indicoceani]
MQRSEVEPAARPGLPDLDLRRPVRLEFWAALFASGIVCTTVAPLFGVALVAASVIVAASAALDVELVPEGFRLLAVLAPLFVGGGYVVAALHASAPDPLAELAALEPGAVTVVGEVASPPVASGFGERADLRVEGLSLDGREVLRGGGVEVYVPGLDGVGVGDRLRVTGELSVPTVGDDGFDYARYLRTERISAVLEGEFAEPVGDSRGWIGSVHRRTDVALGYGLRPTEAAVVRGMVLGDRSLIPEELDEAFSRSGITHVLAISGQHVVVLAAGIFFAAKLLRVPRVPRIAGTVLLVWLYIVIAGAPPSAIRAGVVATLVLSAGLLARRVAPLHFMSVMLAAVLAWNPLLVYNTGFQLSVAAVFGILVLRKPLKSLVEATVMRPLHPTGSGASGAVANLLAVSLSAQVATAPIIASSFDQVSIVGVLTNLIAVPLAGPILALGLFSAIFGNVAPLLAYPPNAANGALVYVLEVLATTTSSFDFAAVATPGVTVPMVAAFYVGCIPAALCRFVVPENRWTFWAGIMLAWVAAWLFLAHLGDA